ncbi:MAG: MFS transporter [Verrucomicrobia bacterium]|nr:MAG: MFS transporter [Verrucomicrobiota bacterium]
MREQFAEPRKNRHLVVGLWVVFFFHGMSPGFWVPALTNMLKSLGLSPWVAIAFVVPPLCALFAPLLGGALADHKVAAQRLLMISSMLSALFTALAFAALDWGWNPWWFIFLLGIQSILAGPSWGLLTTISMTHLRAGEKQFPLVRVGATLGWVIAGLMTSFLWQADHSPKLGYAAAGARLIGGVLAGWLPHTPPLGVIRSWWSRVGLDALVLFKQRDHAVFFVVTTLYSIPLTAFYMYAPEMLEALGNRHATAVMTTAQITEMVAMFVVGGVMVRYRVKVVLLWALGLSILRFGLSGFSGYQGEVGWHIVGIALHGVCYTFYFITAQIFLDRRVDPGLRGQAQGLLSMVSNGIGPLFGASLCAWLRMVCVASDGSGWEIFWGLLAAIIVVCFVLFAFLYRGLGPRNFKHMETVK